MRRVRSAGFLRFAQGMVQVNRRAFLFSSVGLAGSTGLSLGCGAARNTALQAFTIPIIDISQDEGRQVIIEKTPGQYLGQVDTVLFPDDRTVIAAYPLDHGGPGTILKRSGDAGLTWSERLPTPDNFLSHSHNAPAIHRLVDSRGKARLILIVSYPVMMQSISEDDGRTWTPLEPMFGDRLGTAPPKSIIPIKGNRHLMLYNSRFGTEDGFGLVLTQTISQDGGQTWCEPKNVGAHSRFPGAMPCEPALVRSPDGTQILCLIRENASKYGGLWMVSDDEGETWSQMRQLPAALHGDRHVARYGPDGRLVITVRDNRNPTSPTAKHFVGWVGRYEDIIEGREGQYRLLLQRHYGRSGDTGYAGLEVLPDGTFVSSNYVAHKPGEVNSIISTRFTLDEIDELAATAILPRHFAVPFQQQIDEAQSTRPKDVSVFVSGEDGVAQYRIPVLLTSSKQTLLAFCDARVDKPGDAPNKIDLVLKRSFDQGQSWLPMQRLVENGAGSAANACGLVDRETGRIWLFYLHCPEGIGSQNAEPGLTGRTVMIRAISSDDDGETWSEPIDLTAQMKRPEWAEVAAGPGVGIQTSEGRLILPMYHGQPGEQTPYVVWSDDHGESWQIGGDVGEGMNEGQVIERDDGSLMINMRSSRRTLKRAVALSKDGGRTWSVPEDDSRLVDPVCQASLLRYSGNSPDGRNRLLFSNPASIPRDPNQNRRQRMVVRLSYDMGERWPEAKCLHYGRSAYSCLAVLPDGSIGLLYEKDEYKRIVLTRITLDWLTDGRDQVDREA